MNVHVDNASLNGAIAVFKFYMHCVNQILKNVKTSKNLKKSISTLTT